VHIFIIFTLLDNLWNGFHDNLHDYATTYVLVILKLVSYTFQYCQLIVADDSSHWAYNYVIVVMDFESLFLMKHFSYLHCN